jgi:hypothetical protein
MKKIMVFIQVYHIWHPYHHEKRIIQMRNHRMSLTIPSQDSWNFPQSRIPHLNGRLLIQKREDSGVKLYWINSESLLRDGMTKIWL